ncbi:metal-sensitive transcriptional regulator [Laceyella sacchari]|jgi:DNA-binding FrmR family transcriptional regulator|uniref:DNA-binding transcriptional regulator, FrmR family n=2 Tax=Laceyella TaxID=292635 RepID=A0AA45WNS9_9BACL|nr:MULTISPECIES: metal-sensitive transcriptional regulator [Laceyella]AUS08802.1 metal-sensitive transcriptional regulator [Laceyella sacchari]KPC68270.1 cytoplasmic protein [Thermoactinomyces vulgaris]MRG27228.1 metal-sensing transcriptional repressor [Laceyella tengchongensis]PRZ14259.1 DNA-binding FrmR family transcriptional regulator [Laceyella sediminis]SMP19364.1 DNA-binding transcriptional regulator, FrmR family [Laceyella tengchongensis]
MTYDDDVKVRLRRIEGQVRGVLRMMDEDKDCKDVVSQLSAIRSAVDRSIAYILTNNLEQCLRKELEKGQNADTTKLLKEAMNLLIKTR